jgi:hypothetical protein
MERMIRRLLNGHLMRRLRVAERRAIDLERQAEASAAKLELLECHVALLEDVIARERARVLAETQIHAMHQVAAERGAVR